MKRLILLFTFILIASAFNKAFADPTPIPLTQDPIENSDESHRGQRMPPAPIMVVVDVEAGTVSGTSPLLDGIVRYEILEADGSLCIADADNAAAAFRAVDDRHGTYMLRLRGNGYTLTGYIDL